MKPLKIAVVGATGIVGQTILGLLKEKKFPVAEIVPFASSRSEGKSISFDGRSYTCRVLSKGCFQGVDIAFFDASDAVSGEWVPQAVEEGAWVVDNSATFRLDSDIFLLVPEINGNELKAKLESQKNLAPRDRILTGPNCSTAQMVLALKPIQDRYGLERVVVSTYQSTSGGGAEARQELLDQTRDVLEGKPAHPKIFPHRIAFNCLPHVGGFKEDGYTSEEHKMINEARKILNISDLKLTATAVRVPTLNCHAESINVECKKQIDLKELRQAFEQFPGIEVMDSLDQNSYPINETGSGKDPVYIGRIRRDLTVSNGVNFWVVSDNLRKGAALNAIQIGEILLQEIFS